MIIIPAGIFASVACFVGNDNNNLENVHIKADPENSYIEAVNSHEFCRHAIECERIEEGIQLFIKPTRDLVKACKAKNAEYLMIDDGLNVHVVDKRNDVLYIHPASAKTCEENQYPDTGYLVDKFSNPSEDFSGVCHISLSCRALDIFKNAFGKKATYKFTFTGEDTPIRVAIYDTDFICVVMPLK